MTNNINIKFIDKIKTPLEIKDNQPVSLDNENKISSWRETISNIINGKDKRLLVVVGPCSIHDYELAITYAKHLKKIAQKYNDRIFVVMRVYFEKPRTTIGWKGLINDPYLDNSCKINEGINIARQILLDIVEIGLPVGCEFLDVFLPQYYADLVSWGAIGARTTESQLHRQLASGLSMPIGFKNGTGGSIDIAGDALICARNSHVFLGINNEGKASLITTKGNNNVHIILRGSKNSPNYYPEKISETFEVLKKKELPCKVMIDMSHGNSRKKCKNQLIVSQSICNQIQNCNDGIIGVMIESNIKEGRQNLTSKDKLIWGLSITDECINIETTDTLLNNLYESLKIRFNGSICNELL